MSLYTQTSATAPRNAEAKPLRYETAAGGSLIAGVPTAVSCSPYPRPTGAIAPPAASKMCTDVLVKRESPMIRLLPPQRRPRAPLQNPPLQNPPLQNLPPPFPTVSFRVRADGVLGHWRVPVNGAVHIGATRALIRDHIAQLRCTKNADAFYKIMRSYRYDNTAI